MGLMALWTWFWKSWLYSRVIYPRPHRERDGGCRASVVLTCVPSHSSDSLADIKSPMSSSLDIVKTGIRYVSFLECDYTYIKILELLKNVGRFILEDSYPVTSVGLLTKTFITFLLCSHFALR